MCQNWPRQAPEILCCCGEATPVLVGTALSNGHLMEEAWFELASKSV